MADLNIFITDRCTGCGRCQYKCPKGCIIILKNGATIDKEKCDGCKKCIEECSLMAIKEI